MAQFTPFVRLIYVQFRSHRSKRPSLDVRPKKLSIDATSEITSEGSFYSDSDGGVTETQSQLLLPSSTQRSRARSRSRDRRAEPQGLHVLYEPSEARTADIIFVHGLGGSSVSTWTRDGDDATFWPERFLPSEPAFSRTRIMSFGYTAFFLSTNSSGKINIMDFARSLLANLKNRAELGIGQASVSAIQRMDVTDLRKVPIIFVAHSLGGLVVKKVRS